MPTEIKLPELGENITAGDVVKVLVAIGDTVAVDQPLLELETDKASFDVPSPVAGKVVKINVEEGKKAAVGAVIVVVEEGEDGKNGNDGKKEMDGNEGKKEQDVSPEGAADTSPGREARGTGEPAPDNSSPSPEGAVQERGPISGGVRRSIPQNVMAPPPAPTPREGVPVPAAPSVRMFARELGVDITEVKGSGAGGRISEEDVKKYVKSVFTSGAASAAGGTVVAGMARPALPDFSVWGEITREPMSKVRRMTAEHMEISGAIPTVTQHDKADVSRLEELRKSWAKKAERAGVKLTVTAIAMKVAAAALRKFPQFNASIDMASGEIIYKKYVHLGVAVDTERGLLVPVVRDVDRKNILEISREMQELAEKARTRKIMPDEMQGASFTITNLGGIGGTAFTPIINSPEVAILGLSRSAIEPVYIDGQFQPRMILPLSLTYDHRIIDGADAARFVRWIAEALEEPLLMALEG
jgi:pyruvate dehydrogenase E2 component (dihydrolipoamide acetyltransferase)